MMRLLPNLSVSFSLVRLKVFTLPRQFATSGAVGPLNVQEWLWDTR
jgi:hypothetical protein